MFRLEDIICSNKFTRKFQAIVKSLNHCPKLINVKYKLKKGGR